MIVNKNNVLHVLYFKWQIVKIHLSSYRNLYKYNNTLVVVVEVLKKSVLILR